MQSPLLSSRDALVLGSSSRSDFALHALDAYQRGDYIRALALIDRCCRAFVPDAEHYRLRAAISEALGAIDAAERDLTLAVRLTPDDLALQAHWLRILVENGSERDIAALARGIFQDDRTDLHADIVGRVLATSGETRLGRMWLAGEVVALHCLWQDDDARTLTLRFGDADTRNITLTAGRPEHYAAAFNRGAHTTIPWEDGSDRCQAFWPSGEPVAAPILRPVPKTSKTAPQIATTAAPPYDAVAERATRPAGRAGTEAPITVLVPAYRNLPATRDCIEAALREPGLGEAYDLLVVDDASPEPELSAYLRALADENKIRLLVHSRNRGFIHAVESGLAETRTSDIILLNADTVVPAGWLRRMRTAAYAAEAIGTVTPLSNNGDLTSYPVPFGEAPMPEPNFLALIDATAARVNAGEVIDLPSGIGFCFYIKRTCLAALEVFGSDFLTHGYFEDVDFCLRAAENGFRNVCATDIVVGHLGSASYLDAKRGLVLLNQAETLRRFPELSRQTSWFMQTDPLRASRNRITEGLWPEAVRATTAVFSTLSDPAAGKILLSQQAGLQEPWIHITPKPAQGVPTLAIEVVGLVGGLPVMLTIPADDSDRLEALLRTAAVERIIALAGEAPPETVIGLAERLGIGLDAVLVEAPRSARDMAATATAWGPLMQHATRVVPGCASLGEALGETFSQIHGEIRGEKPGKRRHADPGLSFAPALQHLSRHPADDMATAPHPSDAPLAIVPLDTGPASFSLTRALALAFNRSGRETPLLVLGETLDDEALMRLGNVFVLGHVEPADWPGMIATYRCAGVIVPCRRMIFADLRLPLLAALPQPVATFAHGLCAELVTGPRDLGLAAGADDKAVAAEIEAWLGQL